MNDIFDAIFGYYMVTLGAGAFAGVRATLRTVPGGEDSIEGSGAADQGGARPPLGERGRAAGQRAARGFQKARGNPRTRTAVGWLSGVRVYRAGRSGGAGATGWVVNRRTVQPDGQAGPEAPSLPPQAVPAPDIGAARAPGAPKSGTPDSGAPAPAGDGAPPQAPDSNTAPDVTDAVDTLMRAVTDPVPAAADSAYDAPAITRPRLFLVPPLKEYPPMPSADINDLESLLGFTQQAAGFAGMESEDALAASASTIAAAEFAGETARRVGDEVQAVEMAIATMAVLGVDAETSAAYMRLHEAGGAYRDLADRFAAGCADLAAIAENMSGAASNYHESAVSALDTVNTHQMPHAEAAMATGHSGADGQFYGVANTHHQPLPAPATAGALPAGD